MTWGEAAPAVGAAVALLLLPGLTVTAAAGVRGVLSVALAPVLSVGLVAGAAVVAPVVGMRWGWPAVAVATVVSVLVVGGVRVVVGRRVGRSGGVAAGDAMPVWLAAGAGVVAGGLSLGLGFARGVGQVDRWPQTFDAVFHLSASWHVLTGGDGSSLTLGTLTAPGAIRSFYPAAWHDLVALVAGISGVPVTVASSSVSLSVLAVAWPLGTLALARAALGARPVALVAAGALAAGVTASPVVLASYGTLWPNALGTALLPGAGALLVVLLRRGPTVVARPLAALLLPVALLALALAHPNTVVSLLVLAVGAGVVAAWPVGGRWRRASLAAVPVTVWLVAWSPVFAATRGTSWPARETVGQALGEWLLLSPQRLPVPFAVAVLVAVGVVVAWRRRDLRWLVAAHAVGGALFALVAGSDGTLARLASGPWYDDAWRLAALAGVTAVPLAALGVEAVGEWLVAGVRRVRGRPVPAWAGSVAGVGVLVAVAVVTGGLSWSTTGLVTGWWYRYESILDPGETALMERLPSLVPAGGVVAGNPFDGAAESGAVGGRTPLYPHLSGRWDADRVLVGAHLREAATHPDVCAAVRRLGVTHVLTGEARFWVGDHRRRQYAGLEVAGAPGFRAVTRSGASTLWRVTACG